MLHVRTGIGLVAVFLFGCTLSNAQYSDLKFRHITPSEGLSQGTVTSYCQDSNGFIWAGTRDGLNRFDGYTFSVFKYDSKDSFSLSNNHIMALLKTGEDKLWVATWGGGLNLFDLKKNKFIRLFNGHNSGLSKSFIYCLAEDSKGILWIGTDGQGLYSYDKNRNILNHYNNNPLKKESLADNTIRTIFEDHSGKIWIGTQNAGLELYDSQTDGFIHFRHNNNDNKTPSGNTIRTIR
ncbi:MAG TPA: two-component regulator propeller domain-containing protein, partial [Bacteroidales bacterium]|nr:two-component regulator propeller domain-containing protein [Bacteroidales bacterium]